MMRESLRKKGRVTRMKESNKDQYLLKSLDSALTVLQLFEGGQALSLGQVVQRSGMNRTVVFRILYTLEQRGFLFLEEDGRYAPGVRLAALGAGVVPDDAARRTAGPLLRELSASVNETVHFSKRLDSRRVILLDEILPRQTLVVLTPKYESRPMHLCSTGLAVLAAGDDAAVREYAQGAELEKKTETSIASADRLLETVEQVRRDGYAVNDQFFETGVCSIAVPVPARQGGALYAVSVSGPSQRIRDKQETIVAELRSVCRRLAEKLT